MCAVLLSDSTIDTAIRKETLGKGTLGDERLQGLCLCLKVCVPKLSGS
jgi:hypothetical protein